MLGIHVFYTSPIKWLLNRKMSFFFCRIIESRAEEYPIGKHVVASFGWRNYTIGTHKPPHYLGFPAPRLLPDLAELPISLGIGMLGTTG